MKLGIPKSSFREIDYLICSVVSDLIPATTDLQCEREYAKMKCGCQVLQLFVLATVAACREAQEESGTCPAGILDDFIINKLESLRPRLAEVKTEFQAFETGDQEFGNFRGHFNEVTVKGLDEFRVKTLQTSLLDVKNLTIVEDKIEVKGLYKINGTLAFPLGRYDIHAFGEGPFRAEMSNASVSFKMKLRSADGMNVVKDLRITVDVERMSFNLKNLMGGGELEEVFNQLINDLGLTVLGYYKESILEAVKLQIVEFINGMLNRDEDADNNCSRHA